MLDIATHAIKTVIQTLGPDDRIAIVEFAKTAKEVIGLTQMDDAGKAAATRALQDCAYQPNTNLWPGLKVALDILNERPASERVGKLSHIMVLTDGEAEDTRTVQEELPRYRSSKGIPGTINLFGFGYEIDSPLLVYVAEHCSGSYAFIPDGGMVGTCFVNSVSNLLSTMASETVLTLQAGHDHLIQEVEGFE